MNGRGFLCRMDRSSRSHAYDALSGLRLSSVLHRGRGRAALIIIGLSLILWAAILWPIVHWAIS